MLRKKLQSQPKFTRRERGGQMRVRIIVEIEGDDEFDLCIFVFLIREASRKGGQ